MIDEFLTNAICNKCAHEFHFEASHLELITWKCPACGQELESRMFHPEAEIPMTLKWREWNKVLRLLQFFSEEFDRASPEESNSTKEFRSIYQNLWGQAHFMEKESG